MKPNNNKRQPANEQDILARLNTLTGRTVVVIGDVMVDRYIWGDARRISPAAPVPVVRQRRTTCMLGGGANVARNLAAAGARAHLIGLVGEDETAKIFRNLLREMKVVGKGIITDSSRPTSLKTSILAQGQQLLRFDVEEPGIPSPDLQQELIEAIRNQGQEAEAIVISDYAKGVVEPAIIEAAVEVARTRGIPLIVDPKSADFRRYKGADYLTPNLKEASEAAGIAISGDAQIELEGRKLLRRYKGKGLIITRSGEGFSLITSKLHLTHPAQAREVLDETGCGDTFIAHLALGLAAGWEAESAAMLANTAASLTAGKVGSSVVSPEELAAALGGSATMGKVRAPEGLALLVENLRDKGRRIVFTNGCFDLLHVGHIRHLHEARRLGDILIVALNTDESVRRVKGAPRPVMPANERAAVLAALDDVNYITFFDEDSPERLLAQLHPDVLVKGKQKPGESVIGAELVESYGGKVVELPLYGSASTDGLLRRIMDGGGENEA